MKRLLYYEVNTAIMPPTKLFWIFLGGPSSRPAPYSYFYNNIILIIDKEINVRGACLYLNSKKSNGNKCKNLLGKNERIGLKKK